MPKPVVLDEELLIHMYVDEEISVKDIAASLGTSPATVQRRLKKLGVLRPGKKKSKVDIDLLKEMYLVKNMTMSEIAGELGICLATVQQHLKNAGIEKDKAAIRETYNRTMLDKYGETVPIRVDSINEKIKATNRQRYGADTPLESEEIFAKTQEAVKAHYGVDNAFQSEEVKNKIKRTNMERYGVEHPAQSKDIREKIRQTSMEHWGAPCNLMNENCRKQIRATNMGRYGVEYPAQSDVVRQKIKDTCLERYGATSNMATEDFKRQAKETSLQKYGTEYPIQSDEVQDKVIRTCRERYGNDYAIASPAVRAKIRASNIEKYGTPYPGSLPETRRKRKHTLQEQYGVSHQAFIHMSHVDEWDDFKRWSHNTYIEHGKIEKEFAADYFNVTVGSINKKIREHDVANMFTPATSAREKEWLDFFDKNNIEYKQHVRSLIGLEIDIYIPSINTGIEINPSASHNSSLCVYAPEKGQPKDMLYHQNKSLMAEEKGFRLIHVFDWTDIESIQSHMIADYANRPHQKTYKDFIYQKDGNTIESYIMDNQVLVGYIKAEKYNDNAYDITEYYGTSHAVCQAANKLIEDNDVSTIQWEMNFAYEDYTIPRALSFKRSGLSVPHGFWSPIYQRSNVARPIEPADIHEKMLEQGYGQVYDCGNVLYIWKRESEK